MAISKQQTVITTNYVNRFSCIGEECEDNCCCDGWSIHIDKPHFKKIKKVMSVDVTQKKIFKKSIKIIRDKNSSATDYAHFVLGEQKKCSFLNEESLCGLQARHGAEILPNICTVYPRKQIFNGKSYEVYATLSCPEMVRLCLLDDDAMHLIKSKMDVTNNFGDSVGNLFYDKYFAHIRTTIIDLLTPTNLSINQRLFLTIFFAIRTEQDFYKTVETDPGQKLQNHIQYISKPDVKNEILEQISGIVFSYDKPLKILLGILTNVPPSPFIISTFQQGFGVDITQKVFLEHTFQLSDIYALYKKRSDQIEAVYGKRLDQYFTNYSMNYWLGSVYMASDDLVIHSRKLLVRIACLRFMLFCHKNIITLLKQDDITGQQDLIDRTAVEVFYQFSRMYESDRMIMQTVEDDIVKNDYGLSVLASLIKF